MSRHQAYRNYDYENDLEEYEGVEGDGYDDEGEGAAELSAEDQSEMRAGTASVRSALADGSLKVTDKQIQDALWHYYYDVDKAVAYLISKYIAPPAPKAPKGASEKTTNRDLSTREHETNFSHADFFRDTPWLNVPVQRQAILVAPIHPRAGLLGGSSAPPKLSKLQQLALARKKKSEGQKSEEEYIDVRGTTLRVAQLSVKQQNSQEKIIRPHHPAGQSNSTSSSELTSSGLGGLMAARKRKTSGPSEAEPPATKPASERPPPKPLDSDLVVRPAAPSAFAQTLLGPPSDILVAERGTSYSLPYMAHTSSIADVFAVPSPDDIVLRAQSKASNKSLATVAQKRTSTGDKSESATDAVRNLKVVDTPLPKSKNLDVVGEYESSKKKKIASFVVVGHVDAGKSTLMGRLLLDLDVVDQRTIERYRKEAETMGKSSFALAWVLDQRTEERSRGVTIDIATNKFETQTTSFTILDAPGHRDFIPNMIAGASQADFAILVVDASTGAFEAGLKGQTREHSLLIRSMGVSRVIVAVNKLDTVGWSRERFDEIQHQVSGFLSATGFQLKNVSFVPVSGLHGDNIVKNITDPAASWYTGETLLKELENSEPTTRALDKPLRLTISEVFKTAQSPVSVSGRVDAGSLQMGDALSVQPSAEKAYVKSLEVDGELIDWAVAGQNIIIHLTHIDPTHVRVGDIICSAKAPIACIDTFTIKVLAFDILMPMQIDVHRGRLHAAGQILEMPALLDKVKGTVTKRKPKIVKPGSVARVLVKMATRVPLEAGQRVVLRSNGETVAAGILE